MSPESLEGLKGLAARENAARLIDNSTKLENTPPWEIANQTPEQYYDKVINDMKALQQIAEGESDDPTKLSPAEVLESLSKILSSVRWLLQEKELKNLRGLTYHLKALIQDGGNSETPTESIVP